MNSDQLAPDAVRSREVKDLSLQYRDLDPAGVPPRMFAHVNSSGVLGERSPSVVEAGRISKGQYYAFVAAVKVSGVVSDSVPG